MHFALVALLAVAPLPAHSLTYSADCAGITITSSGYDEGAAGMWSIGDEPPRPLILNESRFTPWPLSQDGGHHQFVIMAIPGDLSEYWNDDIQCETTITEPAMEPEQVDIGTSAEPPAPVEKASPWAGVELAPPW